MSATLDYRIVVNLLASSPPISRQSFDNILLLAEGATFGGEYVRTYNTTTAIDADSAVLDAPTIAYAKKLFAQSVNPGKIKIGKSLGADYGADLTACAAEDPDFYCVVPMLKVQARLEEAALWTESQRKILVTSSPDAGVLASTPGTILVVLEAAAYKRTALIYHATTAEALDLCWAAYKLSCNPDERTTTWAKCHVVGPAADAISDTERGVVIADGGNVYLPFYGVAATDPGQSVGKKFIDTVISGDWVVARIQEAIAQLLLDCSSQNTKIPYDDSGIGQIAALVRNCLKTGESRGHFRAGSSVVTVPKLADISSATIATRSLTLQASTILAGAVDQAVTISLVVNAA